MEKYTSHISGAKIAVDLALDAGCPLFLSTFSRRSQEVLVLKSKASTCSTNPGVLQTPVTIIVIIILALPLHCRL
jgi:hypothetical protein